MNTEQVTSDDGLFDMYFAYYLSSHTDVTKAQAAHKARDLLRRKKIADNPSNDWLQDYNGIVR